MAKPKREVLFTGLHVVERVPKPKSGHTGLPHWLATLACHTARQLAKTVPTPRANQ